MPKNNAIGPSRGAESVNMSPGSLSSHEDAASEQEMKFSLLKPVPRTSSAADSGSANDANLQCSPTSAAHIRPIESCDSQSRQKTCAARVVTPELEKTCTNQDLDAKDNAAGPTTSYQGAILHSTKQSSQTVKSKSNHKRTSCRGGTSKKRRAPVNGTPICNRRKVGRPRKVAKRENTQFTLKVVCNSTVVASWSMSKKHLKSSSTPFISATRPSLVRANLDYKVLLGEYGELVKKGTCQPVSFGNTLRSAKTSISKAILVLSKSLPEAEDADVLEEQKEFRRSMRQMRRFEDQEKLSLQNDALESYERAVNSAQKLRRTGKQKVKAMEAAMRVFCDEPVRYSKSRRLNERHVCECLVPSRCVICSTIDFTPAWFHSQTPKIRRVDLFDLKDENDADGGKETQEVSDLQPVMENSVVALKNLLHSLEFVEEEMRK